MLVPRYDHRQPQRRRRSSEGWFCYLESAETVSMAGTDAGQTEKGEAEKVGITGQDDEFSVPTPIPENEGF